MLGNPQSPVSPSHVPETTAGEAMIRVAVVEDQALVREGMVALIDRTPGLLCVASAGDHVTAIRAAEFSTPDVALLDLTAPESHGSLGLTLWTERLPQVRLLLYDEILRDGNLRIALRVQAAGYLTKRDRFAEWLDAIRLAMRDEPAFSPSARARLRATPRGWEIDASSDVPGLHCLTARETEVLTYLAQGLSGKQCSALLGISPSTVDNHKSRIMRKLKVRKTVELTRLALREGLVPR